MNAQILEQVREAVADLFNLPLDEITAHSSPDTVRGWDSIQHLNLVLVLEQKFSLQFEPEEVEQMLSVELVALIVEDRLIRKAAGAARR